MQFAAAPQRKFSELYPRVGFIVTNMARRFYANFTYQAGSWTHPRRVIAKVEWHPGARPATNVVAFYNKRGTCEQWIKEGKGAIKWTRLSCLTFAANWPQPPPAPA